MNLSLNLALSPEVKISSIRIFKFFIIAFIFAVNINLRLRPVCSPVLADYAKQELEGKDLEKQPDLFIKKYKEKYKEVLKRYQDDNDQPYLLGYDSYHWKRYTKLLLQNGYTADEVKEGVLWDDHMFAPYGAKVTKTTFMFYLTAYLYRAVKFFYNEISIDTFIYYIPVFYAFLFLLVLYGFVRYLYSFPTACLSVLIVGLTPIVLYRTSAGWFDMDVLSLFFSVLVAWITVYVANSKSYKTLIAVVCLAASLMLFALTWQGWWYIFLLSLGFLLVAVFSRDNIKTNKKKKVFIVLLLVLACEFLSFMFLHRELVLQMIDSIRAYLTSIRFLANPDLPNGLSLVKELAPGSFLSLSNLFYGEIILLLACLSFVFLFYRIKDRLSRSGTVFLLLWFVAMLIATLNGIRFFIFLSIPLAVSLSFTCVELFKITHNHLCIMQKGMRKRIMFILFGFIISTFMFHVYQTASNSTYDTLPFMDDERYEGYEWIRKNTETDAIIFSWWDYGAWIKEISDRSVVFDGQSQDTVLTVWMGRYFMSDDEQESVRILNTIANSSMQLYWEINYLLSDNVQTMKLLQRLWKSDKTEAQKILKEYGFDEEKKQRILKAIYTKPKQNVYVLVNEDMVNITPTISSFGNWSALKKQEREKRRDMFSDKPSKGFAKKEMVVFKDGTVLDLREKKAFKHGREGFEEFDSFAIYDKEDTWYSSDQSLDRQNKTTRIFSKQNNESWHMVQGSSDRLARTLFSRMYFGNGQDLDLYKKLFANKKIKIYKHEAK